MNVYSLGLPYIEYTIRFTQLIADNRMGGKISLKSDECLGSKEMKMGPGNNIKGAYRRSAKHVSV